MKNSLPILVLLATALAALPRLQADYPIAAHRYLADPAAMVHDGRIYVYCSNDDENPTEGGYSMKSIVCLSSIDLKNWTDHGEVFRVPSGASWATYAWAPAVIARNGAFYLYFGNSGSGIGVASSTSPTGPFTDAKGGHLINSSTPGVLPATNIWIFDPAVFIDDDGQAYLYFGGNGEANVRIIRLNEDMVSTSGSAIALTVPYFFEAAWMHQRNGIYYFSYSTNPSNGMRIDYLTGDSPIGPFTYRGVLAGQPPNNHNNNHAAVFELNGAWYHVYHNRIVAAQAGIPTTYRRNLAIERFDYNADGSIQQVAYTTDGVPQAGNLNPYVRVEGETFGAQSGVETEPCSEGGMNLTQIDPGDWVRIRGVDFGSVGASEFSARVASAGAGGTIELRLDSLTGNLVGTCTVPATGGAQSWTTVACVVSGASGVHDLYLRFAGEGSSLFNLDGWQFTAGQPPQIALPPRPLTLAPGGRVTLWVDAGGTEPLSYRWFRDGVEVAGAVGAFLEFDITSGEHAGAYTVEVTNAFGTQVSAAAAVALDASATAGLGNMSVRCPLGAGATLIPGFVLSGGSSRQVLMRAVGPGLAEFGVVGWLSDPAMTLYSGPSSLFFNDDWSAATNAGAIASTAEALHAFALEHDSRDAAALTDLARGLYTAHVTGVGGSSGVVLFELYGGSAGDSRFGNISARADIGTGENIMIPGFVIDGTGAKTLLIRAVGPSLQAHGVVGWLADPGLTLYQGNAPIRSNDDWGQAPDVAALVAASNGVHAFVLEEGSADAAMLVSLMPGTYTAQARGMGGTTGNVLVEVYEVR